MPVDSIPELKGARKSLILTTAISIVLAANESSGISWAVTLSGWKAWMFLLVAHAYYWLMWVMHGGAKSWRKQYAKIFRDKPSWSQSHQRPEIMMYGITNIVGMLGFLVIGLHLLIEAIFAVQAWRLFE